MCAAQDGQPLRVILQLQGATHRQLQDLQHQQPQRSCQGMQGYQQQQHSYIQQCQEPQPVADSEQAAIS
jgi:hypothetical protein